MKITKKLLFSFILLVISLLTVFCTNAVEADIAGITDRISAFCDMDATQLLSGKISADNILAASFRLYQPALTKENILSQYDDGKISEIVVPAEQAEAFICQHFHITKGELHQLTAYDGEQNIYHHTYAQNPPKATLLAYQQNGNDFCYYFCTDKAVTSSTAIYCLSGQNDNSSFVFDKLQQVKKLPKNVTYPEGWTALPDGTYHFIKNGKAVKGMIPYQKTYRYLLDDNHLAKNEFITDNQKTYYFQPDGTMFRKTGIQKVNAVFYYFQSDFSILKEAFQTVGKKTYYFSASGKMYQSTGKKKIGKIYYFFLDDHSIAKKAFKTSCGKTYYFKADGSLYQATGKKKIGEKYYFFLKDHSILKKAFQTISKKTYYFKADGSLYQATGKKSIGSDSYFFKNDYSIAKSSFQKDSKYSYYFGSDGKMLKNTIIGSDYVDSSGIRLTDSAILSAVRFVNTYSSSASSRASRLRSCFNALYKNYSYARRYDLPSHTNIGTFAQNMFTKKAGNCFSYAAAFAYIAKVLGYTDVCLTSLQCWNSAGMYAPHGWTEIKINGTWYIFDPEMQKMCPYNNLYQIRYSQYPISNHSYQYFYLKTSGSKVTW